jgi:type IV pilus assembly protein PilV
MRHGRRSSGFTLVEVMMALSLLAIGLLSLAAMQMTAMQYGARGRHMTKAAAVAEEQMEMLMRSRWTTIPQTPGTPPGWTAAMPVNEVVQGPTSSTEQTYNVSWRITDVDPGRTRAIDVRVQWTEGNRPTRQYAISSLRFNHESL